jgi:hypothetical protein
MKLILSLLFLISCHKSAPVDYMFTIPGDGTYVCDKWLDYERYADCEHVISGRLVSEIRIGETISVLEVPENTK